MTLLDIVTIGEVSDPTYPKDPPLTLMMSVLPSSHGLHSFLRKDDSLES